jgi:acetate kinase
MTDAILVLNGGSSSLKFALYSDGASVPEVSATGQPILRGKIANIGNAAVFSAYDGIGNVLPLHDHMVFQPLATHEVLTPALLDWLQSRGGGHTIKAAGHRVVHGGRAHSGPARDTDTLMAELEALVPLAPLHQPHNLAAIRSVTAFLPDIPQIACFDTSFHTTQDRLAQLFALPRALTDQGILRYGFHGLSYDYIAGMLPSYLGRRAEGRVIVAHLGNEASMCALKNWQGVAASMGFTALDGLMMGQRCGALDPGVVLHLLEQKGMSPDEITQLLYHQSGLLGVSGISNNMATLQASAAPEAREAIELFCYRAASELAALCAPIGGLDAIVFTAGIGENSALVRSLIIDRLTWMGMELDPVANEGNQTRINAATSRIDVAVIPTDEESVIARPTQKFLHVYTSQ